MFAQSLFANDFNADRQQQLNNLAQLIGRKWWLGRTNFQEFRWGMSYIQIKLKMGQLINGKELTVAEGFLLFSGCFFY